LIILDGRRRAPRIPEPVKRWLAFLRNHREAIAAMDFFTVPTLTFHVLYCFFIISHDRRRILHFNVSDERLDCAAAAGGLSIRCCSQVPPIRSRREVWIGSLDCDSIHEDRLRANLYPEPLAERRRRALSAKLPPRAARPRYCCERAAFEATCFRLHLYHEDRTHLGLHKRTPAGRSCAAAHGPVISRRRLGGLHHRYDRAA
jgi:putative transposase